MLGMLPKVVQEETSPEVLKMFLEHTINLVEQLKKENKKLHIEKANSDQQRLNLDDQLTSMKKRFFGKSSEKRTSSRPKTDNKRQLTLHGESFAPAPTEEELGRLKEIKVNLELTPEELADIAEEYGYSRDAEWEHLNGFYDESEEVDVVVQSYVRKKNIRHKYRLKASKGTEQEIIVTAPASLKIMPCLLYTSDAADE